MKLSNLLHNLNFHKLHGKGDIDITNITTDSRKAIKGSLFIAIAGINNDGHKFIDNAISEGAVAVVGQQKSSSYLKVPYVQVKDSRQALSVIAQNWYGNPAEKLKLIGVTGTDGKTTTVSMIYHICHKAGKKVGMVSTVEAKINNVKSTTGLHVTNPEPLELQQFLSKFTEHGAKYAIIEVTSHGIDQQRVFGLKFELTAFTNISKEHLDYHKTLDNYAAVKYNLFKNTKHSVVNIDDKYGIIFKRKLGGKSSSYSLKQKSDYQGKILDNKFVIEHQGKEYWSNISFIGKYNYSNLLAAVAICHRLGISIDSALSAIQSYKFPSGRMEFIKNNRNLNIIVDFAHTPNAVKKILSEQKRKGRLLSLVSAEGERDPRKRSQIAYLGSKYSDYVILNPIDTRSEDPKSIGEQMFKGAQKTSKNNYKLVLDRTKAINELIKKAKEGDTILLLGKGHEQSMSRADGEYRWSDKKVVEYALDGKTYDTRQKIT